MTDSIKIQHVDHHRNGVGGVGFYVALVEHVEGENAGQRRLVISFDEEVGAGYTAVLDPDKVARDDNIFMHPVIDGALDYVEGTGNNAHRGDWYAFRLHDAIREHYAAWQDEQSTRRAERWTRQTQATATHQEG